MSRNKAKGTDAEKAHRAEVRRAAAQAWAEQVRAEARRLEQMSNRRAGVQR